jgi:hypothetical protein
MTRRHREGKSDVVTLVAEGTVCSDALWSSGSISKRNHQAWRRPIWWQSALPSDDNATADECDR